MLYTWSGRIGWPYKCTCSCRYLLPSIAEQRISNPFSFRILILVGLAVLLLGTVLAGAVLVGAVLPVLKIPEALGTWAMVRHRVGCHHMDGE